MSISPNGKTIASGSTDNIIRLLEIDNDNKVSSLIGQTAGITSIAFSTDGKFLATGDANKEITLWNVMNPKKNWEINRTQKYRECFNFFT